MTVTEKDTDFKHRIDDGAAIFNVAAASDTPDIIKAIKDKYPDVPVIATGGQTEASIRETILAGANAITYTPPSSAELFKDTMARYRKGVPHE